MSTPYPYDELVIKYLYKPIYEASPEKEKGILDRWIREHSGDARYAYIRSQPSFDADPRNSREGLGDDALKSLECMLPNLRAAYANYYDWFSKDDRDLSMRRRVYSALCDRLSSRIYTVLSYVGGIYLNDVRDNDSLPAYTIVDKATQRTALQTVLQTAKNLDWLDEAARFSDFPITDKKVDALRLNLFKAILAVFLMWRSVLNVFKKRHIRHRNI